MKMQYYTIHKKLLLDFHNKSSQTLHSTFIQKDLYDYADNELIESTCKIIYKDGSWYTNNITLYSNAFTMHEIKEIEKCYKVDTIQL
jgi:hypothetical protein